MQRLLLILLVFCTGTISVPINKINNLRASLSEDCTAGHFKVGSYRYSYETTFETLIKGTTPQSTYFYLQSEFLLKIKNNGEAWLQLERPMVKEGLPSIKIASEEKQAMGALLTEYPIRFTTCNGVITSVDAAKNEYPWVLNIKRGILSMLQFEHLNQEKLLVREIDIHGNCTTQYTAKTRISSTNLLRYGQKERQLDTCLEQGKRHSNSWLQGLANMLPKSRDLLHSSSQCHYRFNPKGMVYRIDCKESHMFRPFSNKTSGALTKVEQNMKLLGDDMLIERKGLKYENVPLNYQKESPLPFPKENLEMEAKQILDGMCKNNFGMLPKQSPYFFHKLVSILKQLSQKEISTIRPPFWNKSYRCRKLFKEAIASCGSEECRSEIVDAIAKGDMKGNTAVSFLTSHSFLTNPTEIQISDMLNVLTQNPSRLQTEILRVAALSLGTMINVKCEHEGLDACDRMPVIQSVVEKINVILKKNDCVATGKKDLELLYATLKSVGNMGNAARKLQEALVTCINAKNAIQYRLAAIHSMRKMNFLTHTKRALFTLYRNQLEDEEVRIASYQQIIRNPTKLEVQNVVANLNRNEVNSQVGAFVYSHLLAINQSSFPNNFTVVKEALMTLRLKRFNTDILRHSQTWQKSYYNKDILTGFNAEGHLIFSPKSYIPRSAMVNLNTELFGHKFNIESGLRIEGFENTMEMLFGEKGYIRKLKFLDYYFKNQHHSSSIINSVMKHRQSKNHMESPVADGKMHMKRKQTILQQYLKEINKKKGKFNMKPTGMAYASFQGSEIDYKDFSGFGYIDKFLNFNTEKAILMFAEELMHGKNASLTKSFNFLNTVISIPTGAGIPLKLAVNGSAVTSLEVGTKMDVHGLLMSPRTFNGEGYVRPSAALEIASSMAIDLPIGKYGLRMKHNLYVSNDMSGSVGYKNNKLQFNLNVPKEPVELLSMTNELVQFANNKELPIESVGKKLNKKLCTPYGDLLGVKLCADLKFPFAFGKPTSPFYPLTGPSQFALTLQRTDKKLTNYQVESFFKISDDYRQTDCRVTLATPNSAVPRNITFVSQMDLKKLMLTKILIINEKELSGRMHLNLANSSLSLRMLASPYGKGININAALRKYFLELEATYGSFDDSKRILIRSGLAANLRRIFFETTYNNYNVFKAMGDIDIPNRAGAITAQYGSGRKTFQMQLRSTNTSITTILLYPDDILDLSKDSVTREIRLTANMLTNYQNNTKIGVSLNLPSYRANPADLNCQAQILIKPENGTVTMNLSFPHYKTLKIMQASASATFDREQKLAAVKMQLPSWKENTTYVAEIAGWLDNQDHKKINMIVELPFPKGQNRLGGSIHLLNDEKRIGLEVSLDKLQPYSPMLHMRTFFNYELLDGHMQVRFPSWRSKEPELLLLGGHFNKKINEIALGLVIPSWRKPSTEAFSFIGKCSYNNSEIYLNVSYPSLQHDRQNHINLHGQMDKNNKKFNLLAQCPYLKHPFKLNGAFNTIDKNFELIANFPSYRNLYTETAKFNGSYSLKDLAVNLHLTLPSWRKKFGDEYFNLNTTINKRNNFIKMNAIFPSWKTFGTERAILTGILDIVNMTVATSIEFPSLSAPQQHHVGVFGSINKQKKEIDIDISLPSWRNDGNENINIMAKADFKKMMANIYASFPSWKNKTNEQLFVIVQGDQFKNRVNFTATFPSWRNQEAEFAFLSAEVMPKSERLFYLSYIIPSWRSFSPEEGNVTVIYVKDKTVSFEAHIPSWKPQNRNEKFMFSARTTPEYNLMLFDIEVPSYKLNAVAPLTSKTEMRFDPEYGVVGVESRFSSWRSNSEMETFYAIARFNNSVISAELGVPSYEDPTPGVLRLKFLNKIDWEHKNISTELKYPCPLTGVQQNINVKMGYFVKEALHSIESDITYISLENTSKNIYSTFFINLQNYSIGHQTILPNFGLINASAKLDIENTRFVMHFDYPSTLYMKQRSLSLETGIDTKLWLASISLNYPGPNGEGHKFAMTSQLTGDLRQFARVINTIKYHDYCHGTARQLKMHGSVNLNARKADFDITYIPLNGTTYRNAVLTMMIANGNSLVDIKGNYVKGMEQQQMGMQILFDKNALKSALRFYYTINNEIKELSFKHHIDIPKRTIKFTINSPCGRNLGFAWNVYNDQNVKLISFNHTYTHKDINADWKFIAKYNSNTRKLLAYTTYMCPGFKHRQYLGTSISYTNTPQRKELVHRIFTPFNYEMSLESMATLDISKNLFELETKLFAESVHRIGITGQYLPEKSKVLLGIELLPDKKALFSGQTWKNENQRGLTIAMHSNCMLSHLMPNNISFIHDFSRNSVFAKVNFGYKKMEALTLMGNLQEKSIRVALYRNVDHADIEEMSLTYTLRGSTGLYTLYIRPLLVQELKEEIKLLSKQLWANVKVAAVNTTNQYFGEAINKAKVKLATIKLTLLQTSMNLNKRFNYLVNSMKQKLDQCYKYCKQTIVNQSGNVIESWRPIISQISHIRPNLLKYFDQGNMTTDILSHFALDKLAKMLDKAILPFAKNINISHTVTEEVMPVIQNSIDIAIEHLMGVFEIIKDTSNEIKEVVVNPMFDSDYDKLNLIIEKLKQFHEQLQENPQEAVNELFNEIEKYVNNFYKMAAMKSLKALKQQLQNACKHVLHPMHKMLMEMHTSSYVQDLKYAMKEYLVPFYYDAKAMIIHNVPQIQPENIMVALYEQVYNMNAYIITQSKNRLHYMVSPLLNTRFWVIEGDTINGIYKFHFVQPFIITSFYELPEELIVSPTLQAAVKNMTNFVMSKALSLVNCYDQFFLNIEKKLIPRLLPGLATFVHNQLQYINYDTHYLRKKLENYVTKQKPDIINEVRDFIKDTMKIEYAELREVLRSLKTEELMAYGDKVISHNIGLLAEKTTESLLILQDVALEKYEELKDYLSQKRPVQVLYRIISKHIKLMKPFIIDILDQLPIDFKMMRDNTAELLDKVGLECHSPLLLRGAMMESYNCVQQTTQEYKKKIVSSLTLSNLYEIFTDIKEASIEKYMEIKTMINRFNDQPLETTLEELYDDTVILMMKFHSFVNPMVVSTLTNVGLPEMVNTLHQISLFVGEKNLNERLNELKQCIHKEAVKIYNESPAATFDRIADKFLNLKDAITSYTLFTLFDSNEINFEDIIDSYKLQVANINTTLTQKINLIITKARDMSLTVRKVAMAKLNQMLRWLQFIYQIAMHELEIYLPKIAQFTINNLRNYIKQVLPGFEYHFDEVIMTTSASLKIMKNKYYSFVKQLQLHSFILKEVMSEQYQLLNVKLQEKMDYLQEMIQELNTTAHDTIYKLMEQAKEKYQFMTYKLLNYANIFLDVENLKREITGHYTFLEEQFYSIYHQPINVTHTALLAQTQKAVERLLTEFPELLPYYSVAKQIYRSLHKEFKVMYNNPYGAYNATYDYLMAHSAIELMQQAKDKSTKALVFAKQFATTAMYIGKKICKQYVLPTIYEMTTESLPQYLYQVAERMDRLEQFESVANYLNMTATVLQDMAEQPYNETLSQLYDYAIMLVEYHQEFILEYLYEDYLRLSDRYPDFNKFLTELMNNTMIAKKLGMQLYYEPRSTSAALANALCKQGALTTARKGIQFARNFMLNGYRVMDYILNDKLIPITSDFIYYELPERVYSVVKDTCMENYYNVTVEYVAFIVDQAVNIYQQPFNATIEELMIAVDELQQTIVDVMLKKRAVIIARFPNSELLIDTLVDMVDSTYESALLIYENPTNYTMSIYNYLRNTECRKIANLIIGKAMDVAEVTELLATELMTIMHTIAREDVLPFVQESATITVPNYLRTISRDTIYEKLVNITLLRYEHALQAMKEWYNTPVMQIVQKSMDNAVNKMKKCPYMKEHIEELTENIKLTYQTLQQLYQTPINETMYQVLKTVKNKFYNIHAIVFQRYPELEDVAEDVLNKLNEIYFVLESTYEQPINETVYQVYDYVTDTSLNQMMNDITSHSMAVTKFTQNLVSNLTQVVRRIVLEEIMPILQQLIAEKLPDYALKCIRNTMPILEKPFNKTLDAAYEGIELLIEAYETPINETLNNIKEKVLETFDYAITATYQQYLRIYYQDLDKTFTELKEYAINSYIYLKPTLKMLLINYYNLTDTYVPKILYTYDKALYYYYSIKENLAKIIDFAVNYTLELQDDYLDLTAVNYIKEYIYEPFLSVYPIDENGLDMLEELIASYEEIKNKTMFTINNYTPLQSMIVLWKELSQLDLTAIDLDMIPYYISKLQLPQYLIGIKLPNSTEEIINDLVDYVEEYLPEYERTAMIFAANSVMTFDKEFITIPDHKLDTCNYLLAHEYINNTFTITKSKYAISVRVKNNDHISIGKFGDVLVNKKMVELPQQMQDFNATRVGPFVYVEATGGLKIRCDLKHNLCLFAVPSWFHNRVVGLLGNMDREKSNDWRDMKDRLVPDPVKLADSWEVSGNSRCLHLPFIEDTNANTLKPKPDVVQQFVVTINPKKIANYKCSKSNNYYTNYNSHCKMLDTEYESPLQSCFNVIDPIDFRDVCLHQMCGKKCNDAVCGCDIFAAYVQRCQKEGITLSLPSACSKCDHNYNVNDTWKASPKELDLVIIAHEVPELHKYTKYMYRLISDMSKNTKYMKLRYGLVGYGGDSIHSDAHFHTLNGLLKGDLKQLRNGMSSLNFTKRTNDDSVSAIKFAMDFPFESNNKAMLLFTDTEPSDTTGITALAQQLYFRGILLNVITKGTAYDKKETSKSNEHFSKSTSYNSIAKKGHVWNGDFMTKSFSRFNKYFVKYFQTDVKKMMKTCLKCRCDVGLAQIGQTTCRKC